VTTAGVSTIGCGRRQVVDQAGRWFVDGRWHLSVAQFTVPATSVVLTGELRRSSVTLDAVATVGDLAPAAVLETTKYDDDGTVSDLRRPRSPRYPRGDDTCKMRVKSQAATAVLLSTGGRYHSSRGELLLIVTRVLLLLVPIFNVGLYILSLWLLFLSVFIACILSEFITCSSLLLFLLFNICLFIN